MDLADLLEQSGLPQPQRGRIMRLWRRRNNMPFQTNCVGVALFVVGLRQNTRYVEPWRMQYLSGQLKRIAKEKLAAGNLAVWQCDDSLISTVHAGVVVSKTPLRIFQTGYAQPTAVELSIDPLEFRVGAKVFYYGVRRLN